MPRRLNLNFESFKIGYNYEALSFNNVVVREPSPVDEFYFETTINSDDNTECIAVVDPIRMLFNQKRLSSIGASQVDAWLDSLNQHKVDPLSSIRAKLSDNDLKMLIKSRYIQEPSEIMDYCRRMASDADFLSSEVKKLIPSENGSANLDNNSITDTSENT